MSHNHYVELQMNNQFNPSVPPQSTDDTKPTSRIYYLLSGCGMLIFWIWTIINFILQSQLTDVANTALELSQYMFIIQGLLFGVAIVLAWWANVSNHWGSHLITGIYNLMCIMVYLRDVELKAGFHVWKQGTIRVNPWISGDGFYQCFSSPRDRNYDSTMCNSYQVITIFSLLMTLIHASWCCIHGSYILKNISPFKTIMRSAFPSMSLCLGFLNLALFFVDMVITVYLQQPIASSANGSRADSVMFMVYCIITTLCLLYHAYHPTTRQTFLGLCWCLITAGYLWSDETIVNLKQWIHDAKSGVDTDVSWQALYIVGILFAGLHTIATSSFMFQCFLKMRRSSVNIGLSN